MSFVRSDLGRPPIRTAIAAPSIGQNLAETTASTSTVTRVSSPEVSPNMSLRLAYPGLPGYCRLARRIRLRAAGPFQALANRVLAGNANVG